MSKKPPIKGKKGDEAEVLPGFASEEARHYLTFTSEPSQLQSGDGLDAAPPATIIQTMNEDGLVDGAAVPCPQLPPLAPDWFFEEKRAEDVVVTDIDIHYMKSFESHITAMGLHVLPLTTALAQAQRAVSAPDTSVEVLPIPQSPEMSFMIVQPDDEYTAGHQIQVLQHLVNATTSLVNDLQTAEGAKGKGVKADKGAKVAKEEKKPAKESASDSAESMAFTPYIIERPPREIARLVYHPPVLPIESEKIAQETWISALSQPQEHVPTPLGKSTEFADVPAGFVQALQMFVSLIHVFSHPAVVGTLAQAEGFPFLWEAITPLPHLTGMVQNASSPSPDSAPQVVYTYAVSVFWCGAWRRVIVDDRMPYCIVRDNDTAKHVPLFPVSSDPRELWPALLWKAWFVLTCCPPPISSEPTYQAKHFELSARSLLTHSIESPVNNASLFISTFFSCVLEESQTTVATHGCEPTIGEIARDWAFQREKQLFAWAKQEEEKEMQRKKAIAAERRRRLEAGDFSASIAAAGANTSSAIADTITNSLTDTIIAAALGPPPPPVLMPIFPLVLPLRSTSHSDQNGFHTRTLTISRLHSTDGGPFVSIPRVEGSAHPSSYPTTAAEENSNSVLINNDYYAIIAARSEPERRAVSSSAPHVTLTLTSESLYGSAALDMQCIEVLEGDESSVEHIPPSNNDIAAVLVVGRRVSTPTESNETTATKPRVLPCHVLALQQHISNQALQAALVTAGLQLQRLVAAVATAVANGASLPADALETAVLTVCGAKDVVGDVSQLSDNVITLLHSAVAASHERNATQTLPDERITAMLAALREDILCPSAVTRGLVWVDPMLHDDLWVNPTDLTPLFTHWHRVRNLQDVHHPSALPKSLDPPRNRCIGSAVFLHNHWLQLHWDEHPVTESQLTWDLLGPAVTTTISTNPSSADAATGLHTMQWNRASTASLHTGTLVSVASRAQTPAADAPLGSASSQSAKSVRKESAKGRPSDKAAIETARSSARIERPIGVFAAPATAPTPPACVFIPRELRNDGTGVIAVSVSQLLVTAFHDAVAVVSNAAAPTKIILERDTTYDNVIPRVQVDAIEPLEEAAAPERLELTVVPGEAVKCSTLRLSWPAARTFKDKPTVALGAVYRLYVHSPSGVTVGIHRLPSAAHDVLVWDAAVPPALQLHTPEIVVSSTSGAAATSSELKLRRWKATSSSMVRVLTQRGLFNEQQPTLSLDGCFQSAAERRLPFAVTQGIVLGSHAKVLTRACGFHCFTVSGVLPAGARSGAFLAIPMQHVTMQPAIVSTMRLQADVVFHLGGFGGGKVESSVDIVPPMTTPKTTGKESSKNKAVVAEPEVPPRHRYPHPLGLAVHRYSTAPPGAISVHSVGGDDVPNASVDELYQLAAEGIAHHKLSVALQAADCVPLRTLQPNDEDLPSFLLLSVGGSLQQQTTFALQFIVTPADTDIVDAGPAVLPAQAVLPGVGSHCAAQFPVPGCVLHVPTANSNMIPATFTASEKCRLRFSYTDERASLTDTPHALAHAPSLRPIAVESLLRLCACPRPPEKAVVPTGGRPSSATQVTTIKPAALLLFQVIVEAPDAQQQVCSVTLGSETVDVDADAISRFATVLRSARVTFDGYQTDADRQGVNKLFTCVGRGELLPVPFSPDKTTAAAVDATNAAAQGSASPRTTNPTRPTSAGRSKGATGAAANAVETDQSWISNAETMLAAFDSMRLAAQHACSLASKAVLNNSDLWCDIRMTVPIAALSQLFQSSIATPAADTITVETLVPITLRVSQLETVMVQPPPAVVHIARADVGDVHVADRWVLTLANTPREFWDANTALASVNAGTTSDIPGAFIAATLTAACAQPTVLSRSTLMQKQIVWNRERANSEKADTKTPAKADKKPVTAGATTSTGAGSIVDVLQSVNPAATKLYAEINTLLSTAPWLQTVPSYHPLPPFERTIAWRLWKDDQDTRYAAAVKAAWANPAAYNAEISAATPRSTKDGKKGDEVPNTVEFAPIPMHVVSLITAYLASTGRRASDAGVDADGKPRSSKSKPAEDPAAKADPYGVLQKPRSEIAALLQQALQHKARAENNTSEPPSHTSRNRDFAPLLPPSTFPLLNDTQAAAKQAELRAQRRAAASSMAANVKVVVSPQGKPEVIGSNLLGSVVVNDGSPSLQQPCAPRVLLNEDSCAVPGSVAQYIQGVVMQPPAGAGNEFTPRSVVSMDSKGRERSKSIGSSSKQEEAAATLYNVPFNQAYEATLGTAGAEDLMPQTTASMLLNGSVFESALGAAVKREASSRAAQSNMAVDALHSLFVDVLETSLDAGAVAVRLQTRQKLLDAYSAGVKADVDAAESKLREAIEAAEADLKKAEAAHNITATTTTTA